MITIMFYTRRMRHQKKLRKQKKKKTKQKKKKECVSGHTVEVKLFKPRIPCHSTRMGEKKERKKNDKDALIANLLPFIVCFNNENTRARKRRAKRDRRFVFVCFPQGEVWLGAEAALCAIRVQYLTKGLRKRKLSFFSRHFVFETTTFASRRDVVIGF